MQSNSLFPTITEPTRVCTIERDGQNIVTESLIDNIFVNENLAYNSGLTYSDYLRPPPNICFYSIKINH